MKGSWVIPINSFASSLSLPPTQIKLLLSHGPGSRAFRSWYSLGRPSFGSFSLPVEWLDSPERCAFSWRSPENGLVSQPASWHLCQAVPTYTYRNTLLCRGGGLGRFFFCTFPILTGPHSSCSGSGLGRRLDTKPCFTLYSSNGPGMLISRPCSLM